MITVNAPLMCAGITVYCPLRRWAAGPGKRVAILGFGGLGHVGVQITRALGAHTTALDLSLDKRDDGLLLGADDTVPPPTPAPSPIWPDRIDQAYDRVVGGDVRFRFVIDISTLAAS